MNNKIDGNMVRFTIVDKYFMKKRIKHPLNIYGQVCLTAKYSFMLNSTS